MDFELTRAFASLSSQIADVGRDTRTALDRVNAIDRTTRDTVVRVGRLEKQVFGSDPPPGGVDAGNAPRIVARVSDAEIGLDNVHGMVLAIDGRCEWIETELKKQSGVMGIGKKGLKWLWSPAGGRAIVRLATLAGAAYAAFHSAFPTMAPAVPSSSVVTVADGGSPP